jgi:hypothetical protein
MTGSIGKHRQDDPAAQGRIVHVEQFQQKWEPVLRPELRLDEEIEQSR